MIWEPFVLALVLGIIVSAGLYFAYLWPSVEPLDDEPSAGDGAAPPSETATDRAPDASSPAGPAGPAGPASVTEHASSAP